MVAITFLFFALILAAPTILQYALRIQFPVHTRGAVLISGCSSGIGRHAAFELAKEGYTVFTGVRKTKDFESLTAEAKSLTLKGKIVPIILEVTKQQDIDKAFEEISKFLSAEKLPFVALINNAGVSTRGPVETMDFNKARQVFDINYWGALALTQKFLPLIRRDKGRILFVSSVMGVLSMYGSTTYSGSKWALEAAVDALRLEMLDFGVSVTSILPGYITTAIAESGHTEPQGTPEQVELYKNFWDTLPAKRAKSFKNGAPPQVTSDAILHAVTNEYPRTRYSPGPTGGGLDGEMTCFLTSFLNDRLFDWIKRNI